MSAALDLFHSRAYTSDSKPEVETPSEPRPTVTIPLAPPTEFPTEATSDSGVTSMAPQPSAAVHCLTQAKTQTRPEPDAPLTNSSPNLFTEEARYTVSPIPIDPISRAGVDAPTFLSASLHPKESSSRIFHSHSIAHPFRHRGRSLPPTRLPLSLPGATKRSSTVHFESLGVNSSPVTDLHLVRLI
jgi:hypothetical protein